jgi:PBP1b-binding outer membrane lipoprotein LpoB
MKMKSTVFAVLFSAMYLTSCATSDKHDTSIQPQKIIEAVNSKYPAERINLIYIGSPESFIAPKLAVKEVEKGVDAGKVTAIEAALMINTSTVIISGINDALNAATLSKALTNDKQKIAGGKVIYVGGDESHANLSKLASEAGVSIEFMELPS